MMRSAWVLVGVGLIVLGGGAASAQPHDPVDERSREDADAPVPVKVQRDVFDIAAKYGNVLSPVALVGAIIFLYRKAEADQRRSEDDAKAERSRFETQAQNHHEETIDLVRDGHKVISDNSAAMREVAQTTRENTLLIQRLLASTGVRG